MCSFSFFFPPSVDLRKSFLAMATKSDAYNFDHVYLNEWQFFVKNYLPNLLQGDWPRKCFHECGGMHEQSSKPAMSLTFTEFQSAFVALVWRIVGREEADIRAQAMLDDCMSMLAGHFEVSFLVFFRGIFPIHFGT